ncbi:hypothetical protein Aca07nite_87670 [Actinoplanes capillaceus]|uniref:DUF2637 domain-containing protein n=1 Tax=Actinoplanes campanulatus TaxID=113559 RepID=A0ABQ3WYY5_9ACTN|nr:DUF2637 domain-containing protein [Actinoplanes capillaceus]GID51492.1 hypothetical protein Aca07nite_87670 [Actinoplanes capillaceus]
MPTVGNRLASAGNPAMPAEGSRRGWFQSAAAVTHDVLGWFLAAAATVLAASGQVEYAVTADITDLRRFLVPAILEIAAIFLILGGYLRACDGDSPALLWLLATAVTGFATWTNLTHGGPRAGRIFAAATVVTFVLWLLKLRDRYRAARRASGLIDAPTAKFRLIRWIVMSRQTARAWLLAIEYGIRDADEALDRARLWQDTAHDTFLSTSGAKGDRRTAAYRAADLAVRHRHYHATDRATLAQPTSSTTVASGPILSGAEDGRPTHPDASHANSMRTQPYDPPVRGNGTCRSPATDALAATAASAPLSTAHVTDHDTDVQAPHGTLSSAARKPVPGQPQPFPPERPTGVPARGTPEPPTGTGNTPPPRYEPTSDEDRTMYQTWLRGVAGGHEPTGADLARAAGRPDDSTGTGRKAARRYRDAHAEFSTPGGTTTPDNREPRRTPQPAGTR